MTRWTHLLVALFLISSLHACVYYNTFYNARKQFSSAGKQREASEADPENRILENTYRDYYLSAIKKASVVLDLHPESKWVDDSLLLIGKSYYWRGEHAEALEKFEEILDNFPDSELATESFYWKAIALWGNDATSQSREVLERLASTKAPVYALQARLALAELEQAEENYDLAVRNYLRLADGLNDQELETRVWKGLGDTYFLQASYENALNAYTKVLGSSPDDHTSYQSQLQMGAAHELMDNLDAALQTYDTLEKAKRFRLYRPKVQLRIANVYRLTGDVDAALTAYERIVKQNPRTETSAEAYYQIALIEHEVRRNNELALELFAKARKERSTSDAAVKAREMEQTLFQLDKSKKRAEKETKQGTQALFNVAEIYLFSLGEVDSALSAYQQVLDRADSTYTPKALYGMGLIYADSLNNQEEASRIFGELVESYPITPYAVDARRRIGQDRSDDVLAEARFLEAEALKSEGADPKDVVKILQQVSDEYPQSIYAPKALYALAWAYENDLGDFALATELYTRVAETYPMSDFAEVSEDKIKQIAKDARDVKRNQDRAAKEAQKALEKEAAREQKKEDAKSRGASLPEGEEYESEPDESDPDDSASPQQTEKPELAPTVESAGDTVKTLPSAPEIPETGPLEAGQIDQLPLLTFAPPPESREELGEEGVEPNVTVRMLVGKDGRVTRVVVVDGAEILHEAAVDLAFLYRFEPGKHQGKNREVWMEFPITFLAGEEGEGEPE
jgi:tetratricopeptide (TPR) repeat protein